MLYAIQAEQGGPVKLGFSRDPSRRLQTLQTGNHERLVLRRVWEGTEDDERELHQRFAQWRCGGEWFYAVPPVCELTGAVLDHVGRAFVEGHAAGEELARRRFERRLPEIRREFERSAGASRSAVLVYSKLLKAVLVKADEPLRAEGIRMLEAAMRRNPGVIRPRWYMELAPPTPLNRDVAAKLDAFFGKAA